MAVALLGLLFTHPAFAADGTLDGITSQYQTAAQEFGDRIINIGLKLLVILAGLQLSINMIMKLLGKMEMEDLVAALIKSIITVGIFSYFIKQVGPNMLSIINLFTTAGQAGSGLPELSATSIFNQGIQLQTLMVEEFNAATGANDGLLAAVQNFFPAMMLTAVSLVIILAFAMLAIQMVMVQIELFFVMAVAPILFGFGGISYTRDIAINAFKSAIASGVKMLIIYLVAGVAYTLAKEWGNNMQYVSLTNWWPYYQAMGGALLMAALSLQLPKIAGAIMSGSTALSAGESAAATIGATAGVAALGAGAIAGGAAMAGSMGGMGASARTAMAGAKHAAGSVGEILSGMNGAMSESAPRSPGATSSGGGGAPRQPSPPTAAEMGRNTTFQPSPPLPGEEGNGGARLQPSPPTAAEMGRDTQHQPSAPAAGVRGSSQPDAPFAAMASGDASTASIGGTGKPDTPNQPSAPRVGLHDRLKQVESYMPNDGAQGSVQIDHRTPE